jgi:hypothetical protein
MAKYLDLTGLQSYHTGVKTLLNGKVDKVSGKALSTNDYTTTEKNKLSGIATGAQVNVIESVKVNGTALTPTNKAVNVTVPTKTSQITNDSGFLTAHQDISGKEDKTNKTTSWGATPSDTKYPSEKLVKTALDLKLATSLKGAASGLAELDSTGKVPSSQLPSFVDDVVEVASYANLPTTGEAGKIYVTLDTNKTYRWGGSSYVEISASLALGETSTTAYRGDRGKTAYDHSQIAHAPSTAERNIVVGVQVNGSDLTVDANRKVNVVITGKEDKSNKVSSFQATPDDTHYPTEKLVKDALDDKTDIGHTHESVTKSFTVGSTDHIHTIGFKGTNYLPTYTQWNDAAGEEYDFELYHEGNFDAITSAEIDTILAS